MAGTRLKQKLTNIANSIRNGLNITNLMSIDEMPPNIEDISEIEDAIIDGTISGEYRNSRVTTIYQYAFYGRGGLTKVIFDAVTNIRGNAFLCYVQHRSQLATAEFPSVTSIATSVFSGCSSLSLFNLYSPTRTNIPTLDNANVFTGTPIADGTGYIVINDELVDQLKQANNWSTYANQIIGNTQAAQMGLIAGASAESATVPPPAPLQTIPVNRLDIDEINIDRDLDLDPDLENNERI